MNALELTGRENLRKFKSPFDVLKPQNIEEEREVDSLTDLN